MKKSILIWTKGDRDNGMGHIVRQLHLADELLSRGYQISFEIPDSTPGYYRTLVWMSENQMQIPLNDFHIRHDAVIIDVEHGPNRDFLESAKRKFGKIIVVGGVGFDIHDQRAVDELVDLQIFQSVAINDKTTAQNCLVGEEYIIIGQDYIFAREIYRKTISGNDILVVMGGSDPHDLTPVVAEKVLARRDNLNYRIKVVFGPASHMTVLPKGVKYIPVPRSLASPMIDARLAITALGMTTYEAACVGLPTAVISWSKDHLATALKLEQMGVVVNLGLWNNPDWAKMSEFMHRMNHDDDWQKASEMGKELVDGLGAKRVADQIERLL